MGDYNILFSYHYAKKLDLPKYFKQFDPKPTVFADSGAYSAATLGAVIDRGKYAEWIKSGADYFDLVANLDVIGDAPATWRNQQWLEKQGLHPVPVYHALEDIKWLDRYIDAGYPLCGLGGCVGIQVQYLMGFYQHCFDHVANRKSNLRFHGFGISSLEVLNAFPWYSVDSSSWGSGYRYARLRLFDPITRRERAVQVFNARSVVANADLIKHYGEDPDTLICREKYHHTIICRLSARSIQALQQHCRERHGPVVLDGHGPGAKVFMAGSGGDIEQRWPGMFGIEAAGPRVFMADGHVQHLVEGVNS